MPADQTPPPAPLTTNEIRKLHALYLDPYSDDEITGDHAVIVRLLRAIDVLEATAECPEGDCLPATLKNRAKQLSKAGRHYDARLMETAWGCLEQYRDETVPQLSRERNTLREAVDVAIGHSNCYCDICKDISKRYYDPSVRSRPSA